MLEVVVIEDLYPLVTIGIPTYNRADSYLRQALDSAIGQTYPNIEIVVSDNCSTDNTEALVKDLIAPNLRYYRHDDNIGANNNFNFCLDQARGDYFLLLHDDDTIDEDFVAVCMDAAGYHTDIGIIRTGTRIIDGQGRQLRETPNLTGGLDTAGFFLGWFEGKTAPYMCSTLLNTEQLKEMGGLESKHNLFQDVVAECKLAARYGRVDVRDVKASFREHGSERTFSVKVSQWCEDSLFLLDTMVELVPDEERARVRRKGIEYFAWLNYNFARKIESPLERLSTYLMVYKMFGFRYPPFYFSVFRKGWRRMRSMARRAKQKLAG
jgi:glycosyltransferase involved in cell wall biosynthesis